MGRRLAPEVRRERILDTALDRIEVEGHRTLTMAQLARWCDMSAPGVMHYFPDIPTLLVALVSRRDERDRAALAARLPGADARTLLDGIVANIAARPRAAMLFAMVEADALDPEHPGHEWFRARADWTAAWLADQLGGAEHLPLARRVFAAMDGLQLHFLRDQGGFDLEREWAAVADSLLGPAR